MEVIPEEDPNEMKAAGFEEWGNMFRMIAWQVERQCFAFRMEDKKKVIVKDK